MRPPLRDPDDDNPETAGPVSADAPRDLLDITDPIPPVAPVENPFGLSPKKILFVEAYCGVARFRANEAYTIAGFKTQGGAARVNASKLLRDPRVHAAIAAKMRDRVLNLRLMGGDEALERLSLIARFDIRQMFPDDAQLQEMPDDVALAIKSVYQTKFGRRFEMHDAKDAQKLLAQAAGALTEPVDLDITVHLADERVRRLAGARKRTEPESSAA